VRVVVQLVLVRLQQFSTISSNLDLSNLLYITDSPPTGEGVYLRV